MLLKGMIVIMTKKQYQFGELVGDNGFIFVREIEPRFNKKTGKKSNRRAIFLCPVCAQEVPMDIGPVKRSRTKMCRKCADKIRGEKEREKFSSGKVIDGTDIIFLEELGWQKGHRRILAKCPFCGKEFEAFLDNIKRKHTTMCLGCSAKMKKRTSLGEKQIASILKTRGIDFISQFTFPDCKSIRILLFDFYLPDYNTCIEFDGKQHYCAIDFFGGESSLAKTAYRDYIKNIYCEKQGIGLIRISYSYLNKIDADKLFFFIKNNQGHLVTYSDITYSLLQKISLENLEKMSDLDASQNIELSKYIYQQ